MNEVALASGQVDMFVPTNMTPAQRRPRRTNQKGLDVLQITRDSSHGPGIEVSIVCNKDLNEPRLSLDASNFFPVAAVNVVVLGLSPLVRVRSFERRLRGRRESRMPAVKTTMVIFDIYESPT